MWRALSIAGVVLAVLVARPAGAQPARWWDDGWRYRLKLKIVVAPPGAAAAQAVFPIAEGCTAEGDDVRVIDERGQPCRMRLMYYEPALYGIVAFEITRSAYYHVYLGNAQARRAGPSWEPRAGVFLETLRNPGGDANNMRQFRELLGRADYSFGAGYRNRIFDGINPFGDPGNYLSLYEAYFIAPASGQYLFATVSDDASFLTVDGRPVCQWPGVHDVGGGEHAQHNGRIQLERGAHRLEYLHADMGGEQHCAVAAWMPPGVKQPRVMEYPDFVPIASCDSEPLEERAAPLTPDFRAMQTAKLIRGEETYTAYQFANCAVARDGSPIVECLWQFSDGTNYAGGVINKIFFAKGDFTLTLTVKDGAGRSAAATRSFRVHAIETPNPPEDERLMPYFVDVAARMPLGMLVGASVLGEARLLAEAGRTAEAARVYQELLEREWKIEKKVDEPTVQALVELDAEKLRRPEEAETVLRTQLERAADGPVRARLLLALGRLQLAKLSQAEAAVASLRGARRLAEGGGDAALRREVLLALGDACKATAAADEAMEAYRAAEAIEKPADRNKYDRSSFALATEAYLRTDQLEEAEAELRHWTDLYPTERIAGYAGILEARLMEKRRNVAGAAAYLEQFLKCKPMGAFALMALEDLGDDYREVNRPVEARAAYQKVLDQFQDETVQARIREKLIGLGPAAAATPAAAK